VDADLVRLAGTELHFHQRRHDPKNCTGRNVLTAIWPCVRTATWRSRAPLAGGQRQLNALLAEVPLATHQRQVTLLGLTLAQLRVQVAQRCRRLATIRQPLVSRSRR